MSCTCSFPFQGVISSGVTSIAVNALLVPNTVYLWEITDRFGNKYYQSFTTNNEGYGTIDATQDLPPGFINSSIGGFTIRVKLLESDCNYQDMTLPIVYTALEVSVINSNIPKDNVGCLIELPTSGGEVNFADINYEVLEDAISLTIPTLAGRAVSAIDSNGQSLVRITDFTQLGNTLKRIDGGVFIAGRNLNISFLQP